MKGSTSLSAKPRLACPIVRGPPSAPFPGAALASSVPRAPFRRSFRPFFPLLPLRGRSQEARLLSSVSVLVPQPIGLTGGPNLARVDLHPFQVAFCGISFPVCLYASACFQYGRTAGRAGRPKIFKVAHYLNPGSGALAGRWLLLFET